MALTKESYREIPRASKRKVSTPAPKKVEGCKCKARFLELIPGRGDLSKGEKDRFQDIVRELL